MGTWPSASARAGRKAAETAAAQMSGCGCRWLCRASAQRREIL